MTTDEIRRGIALMRDAGNGRFPVPLVTLEKLLADAEAWGSAPKIVRDAARELRS